MLCSYCLLGLCGFILARQILLPQPIAPQLCGTHCGSDTVTYHLFLWEEIVTKRSDSAVEKGSKLMDIEDFASCREHVAPQSVEIEALVVSCDIWLRWILDFRHLWVVLYSLPCPHPGSDHIPAAPMPWIQRLRSPMLLSSTLYCWDLTRAPFFLLPPNSLTSLHNLLHQASLVPRASARVLSRFIQGLRRLFSLWN